MAKVFTELEVTRKIIELMYQKNHVAGLICELCFLRNFRVGDVRFAKTSDFRKLNGQAEYYLRNDKIEINEWFPIPNDIYNKIIRHIRNKRLGSKDNVFEIVTNQPGPYLGHIGVITHEFVLYLWYQCCKELGVYTENNITVKNCNICEYAIQKNKCRVYGWDQVKRRITVHIRQCLSQGQTLQRIEKHPRLHETLRGAGAQYKIKYYMSKGYDYETAMLKVYHMSNWRSLKTFRGYIDPIFEKSSGDANFISDFGNMILVES